MKLRKDIDAQKVVAKLKAALGLRLDNQLAERLGMSKAALSERIKRNSLPLDKIKLVCAENNINYENMVSESTPQAGDKLLDGYLTLDVRHTAGGGNGQFNELTEIIGQVVIPKAWGSPSIIPVKLRGKSMEPSIMNDAIVGVDKEDKAIISGELYAVMIPYEGVVVKRLFFEADKVQVHSDNPLYPSFAIAHREIGDHFLIGRVKWIVQKL